MRAKVRTLRQIFDGVYYIVRSGCVWRLLPKEYPAWKKVHHHFSTWYVDGTYRRMEGCRMRRGNGEGSVSRRKGGGWVAQYYAEVGGVRKRRTLYARTRGEAAAKLAKAIADRDGGFVVGAGKLTVGEYLDRWLSDGLSPLVGAGKMAHSTYVRYEGITRKHLKPALGHVKLRNLSRPQVRKLYAEKARTLSARSVDYVHVTLQKALSQAMRDDLIPRNVATGERPRSSRQREEVKVLSPAQARALLYAARGTRNEALYVAALHTGLRQGELLGLRWMDVSLAGETGRRPYAAR